MNARRRIEKWFHELEADHQMKREDVCFLMVQARHLIEMANDLENYRVVAFYADWTVHSTIERSPVCFEVLRDVTKAIVENFNPTRPDFTREISRIIGIPQLRTELRNLFRENGLPTIIFDYRDNWKSFVAALLWFLEGQPIGFPEKPTKRSEKMRNEILALQRPNNLFVEALAIVSHENTYHWLLAVSGDKNLSMTGPVEIAEGEDAFLFPSKTVSRGT